MSKLQNNTTSLQNLLEQVNALPEEVILPELSNPADASKTLSGYEFINANGAKVTGTIPTKTTSNLTANGATVTVPAGYYASNATKSVATATRANTTISTTADDTNDKLTITASNNQETGYVTGANKTATTTISLTASGATVTASDGTNKVSKSVATATQATPSISVDSTGKITASATQTAGYVSAGTKSATQQLTTQAAKTVTPSTSEQTAVASGVYTTGAVKVAAMPTATQTTPSITIDSAGKITASATQTAGYVSAGTKSATKQLTTQAAKTVTPTKSSQTAVASGVYTTGAVTVAAIPSQYITTTDATASADEIMSGETAYVNGNKVTGTFSIANELTAQDDLIAQIQAAVDSLPEAGSGNTNSQLPNLILNKIETLGYDKDGNILPEDSHTFEFDEKATHLAIMRQPFRADDQAPYYYGVIGFSYTMDASDLGGVLSINNNVFTYTPATPPSGYSPIIAKKAVTIMVSDGNRQQMDCNVFVVPAVYWTCYLKNTLITLSNYQTKKVQDINYQDDLLVWDFDNGCYTSAKPLWIKKSEIATQYYHCIFENGITLDLVGSNGNCHAIFNLDDNKFEYANLCVGKNIMTQNGPTKLLSCELKNEVVEFYNIITNYHMNCYANNILTSTVLNNIYPIQNMQFIKDNRQIISKDKFNIVSQQYYYGLRLGEQNILPPEKIDKKIAIWHNAKLKEV